MIKPFADKRTQELYATGDRAGKHAIAVNDQWRICVRYMDGDAYDVEVCDYH